jgi:hypothetical protein
MMARTIGSPRSVPAAAVAAAVNGGPVIGLPDGAQVEVGDDLARVLTTGFVAAGVEVEQARLDPELIGDDLDDRGGQPLVDAQRAPEVMDQGELHRKAKPVVLPPMPPRPHDVLWRERIAALHRVVIGRRVEQGSAQLRREDRGGRHAGHLGAGPKRPINLPNVYGREVDRGRNLWTGPGCF